MSGKRVQLFSVAGMLLLVLSIAALARFQSQAQQINAQTQAATDSALKELANYRQWTRVNEEPVPVFNEGLRARGWNFIIDDAGSDVAETAVTTDSTETFKLSPAAEVPSGIARAKQDNSASHVDGPLSFGVVYVNEAARRTLLEEKNPRFPVGSIIVREKLLQTDDAAPQLLVAMVKRGRGFNPEANDWEFLVLDAGATRITEREKTGSCRDCHRRQESNDFVFRSYLPAAIRLGLKEKKL